MHTRLGSRRGILETTTGSLWYCRNTPRPYSLDLHRALGQIQMFSSKPRATWGMEIETSPKAQLHPTPERGFYCSVLWQCESVIRGSWMSWKMPHIARRAGTKFSSHVLVLSEMRLVCVRTKRPGMRKCNYQLPCEASRWIGRSRPMAHRCFRRGPRGNDECKARIIYLWTAGRCDSGHDELRAARCSIRIIIWSTQRAAC